MKYIKTNDPSTSQTEDLYDDNFFDGIESTNAELFPADDSDPFAGLTDDLFDSIGSIDTSSDDDLDDAWEDQPLTQNQVDELYDQEDDHYNLQESIDPEQPTYTNVNTGETKAKTDEYYDAINSLDSNELIDLYIPLDKEIELDGTPKTYDTNDLVDTNEVSPQERQAETKDEILEKAINDLTSGLNPQQEAAVKSDAHTLAVIATPGAGKTKTAVAIEKIRTIRNSATGHPTKQEQQGTLVLTFGRGATEEAAYRSIDWTKGSTNAYNYRDVTHKTVHSLARKIANDYRKYVLLPALKNNDDNTDYHREDITIANWDRRYVRRKGDKTLDNAKYGEFNTLEEGDEFIKTSTDDTATVTTIYANLRKVYKEAKEANHDHDSFDKVFTKALTAEQGSKAIAKLSPTETAVWNKLTEYMTLEGGLLDFGFCVIEATKALKKLAAELDHSIATSVGMTTDKVTKKAKIENAKKAFYSKYSWLPAVHTVIIDEAQDVNENQIKFLEAIRTLYNPDFIVIGDPHQAIFTFQGSDQTYIEKIGHQGETINFKYNYRSTQQILDVANQIFPKDEPMEAAPRTYTNENGETITEIPQGPAVEGYNAANPEDIALDCVNTLNNMTHYYTYENGQKVEKPIYPKDVVFLARTNEELDQLCINMGCTTDDTKKKANRESFKKTWGQLKTVHSFKGGQAPIVFLIGLSQQVWRKETTRDDYEDMRRLLYVGMTRAEYYLHINWTAQTKINGKPSTVDRLNILNKLEGINWSKSNISDEFVRKEFLNDGIGLRPVIIQKNLSEEAQKLLKETTIRRLVNESKEDKRAIETRAKHQNLILADTFYLHGRHFTDAANLIVKTSKEQAKSSQATIASKAIKKLEEKADKLDLSTYETKEVRSQLNAVNKNKFSIETIIKNLSDEAEKYKSKALGLRDCAMGETLTTTVNPDAEHIEDTIITGVSMNGTCNERLCNKSNTQKAHQRQIELAAILTEIYAQNEKDHEDGKITDDELLAKPLFGTFTSPNVHDGIQTELEIYRLAMSTMMNGGHNYEHFDPTGKFLKGDMTLKDVIEWKKTFWTKIIKGAIYFIEIVPNYRGDNTTPDYHVHAHIIFLPTQAYFGVKEWQHDPKSKTGWRPSFTQSPYYLNDRKDAEVRLWHDWWTRCYFYARAKKLGYGYHEKFIETPLDPAENKYAYEHGYKVPGVNYNPETNTAEAITRKDDDGNEIYNLQGQLICQIQPAYDKNSNGETIDTKEMLRYVTFEVCKYITKFSTLLIKQNDDGTCTAKITPNERINILVPLDKQLSGAKIYQPYGVIRDTYAKARRTKEYYQMPQNEEYDLSKLLSNPWFNPDEEDDARTIDGKYNYEAENPMYLTIGACISHYKEENTERLLLDSTNYKYHSEEREYLETEDANVTSAQYSEKLRNTITNSPIMTQAKLTQIENNIEELSNQLDLTTDQQKKLEQLEAQRAELEATLEQTKAEEKAEREAMTAKINYIFGVDEDDEDLDLDLDYGTEDDYDHDAEWAR